jgi:DNA polymerase III delta prime subunit
MRDNIFKYKYRPKSFDDLVLLPRIHKIIEHGLNDHLLLYGTYGIGKTALVDLLCKDRPHLVLNSSLDTSIDVLRTKVDEFCSTMSMFDSKDDLKIVFLDEIDGVSFKYQDALKNFIEKNERNVRFIATTNKINKIDGGVLDRFTKINFDPQNKEEVQFLKVNYAKRIMKISEIENIVIQPKDIKEIVNRNFPSFRRMLSTLQLIKYTGEVKFTEKTFDDKLKLELYELIAIETDTSKIYNFLFEHFGSEDMGELVNLLGRPFIEHASGDRTLLDKLPDIMYQVSKYSNMLDQANVSDPLIIGITLITQIQKIIK